MAVIPAGTLTHVDTPGISLTVEVSAGKGAGSGIASVPTTVAMVSLSFLSTTSKCTAKSLPSVMPIGAAIAGTSITGPIPNVTIYRPTRRDRLRLLRLLVWVVRNVRCPVRMLK